MTDKAIRRALARARDGKAFDETESLVLLGARGADLDPLFEVSARVRDAAMVAAGRPGVVTSSRKVFIPLTRLCRDRCHYCTFVTVPHHLPAAYLSPDEVLDIARAGAAQGCKEALFTLGDRPEDRWRVARCARPSNPSSSSSARATSAPVSRSRAFHDRPSARSAFALSTHSRHWMTVSARRPPSAAKAHSPARATHARGIPGIARGADA